MFYSMAKAMTETVTIVGTSFRELLRGVILGVVLVGMV